MAGGYDMRRIALFGLIAIFILTWSFPVTADQLKDAQQKKSSIDNQIKDVKRQLQEKLGEKSKLEAENKNLANIQQQENKEYNELLNEIKALEEEIKKIDDAIKESEENYNRQKELLKARLRAMSEASNYSNLEALIKSKSLTDFFERIEIISLISHRDKELVEELRIAKKDVEDKKLLKEGEKKELNTKISEKKERIEKLTASRADLQAKIRQSTAELERLNKLEDELLKKSKEMDSLIKSLSQKSKKTKYIGGNMQWPVPGHTNVVSGYGNRLHPILKFYKMHTGIDIDANKGDTIVAANKGTVILAGYQSGYGNTVVIDHGVGITTLYAHCSKLLVKVGDEVQAGQKIALVGSTGLATGPHLHFEVRKDGKTVNPLEPIK